MSEERIGRPVPPAEADVEAALECRTAACHAYVEAAVLREIKRKIGEDEDESAYRRALRALRDVEGRTRRLLAREALRRRVTDLV